MQINSEHQASIKFSKFYKYRHKWRLKRRSSTLESATQLGASIQFCDNTNTSYLKLNLDPIQRHRIDSKQLDDDNIHSFKSYAKFPLRCRQPNRIQSKRPSDSRLLDSNTNLLRLFLNGCLFFGFISNLVSQSESFCPFRCFCNDQSLSANCTQVPSISIVPMTLNPLLKSLTLNQVPIYELSNSLSIYRQLEYLDLNFNQLKQIKYENFNFKPAPSSLSLHNHRHHPQHQQSKTSPNSRSSSSTILNSQQEQLAESLRADIDRSQELEPEAPMGAESGDEIRFHLRELRLANNRIEQLGSIQESDLIDVPYDTSSLDKLEDNPSDDPSLQAFISKRLRSVELERLAPFLTLTRLKLLDLSGNRLTRLHQHAFLGLVRLRQLDLSRNGLEFLSEFAFVGLIELRELKLSQNHLAHQLIQLGRSLCRAPMVELAHLDISDNQATMVYNNNNNNHNGLDTQDHKSLTYLPSRMFVCSPKLVTLRLDATRLRYIQVNAFDNLHQLSMLNLSRNPLEQVPTEAFANEDSNLGSSLRQLDLSETQIEYVNGRSLGSLRVLEKLSMNSMPRLVSFDLASLSFADVNPIESAASSIKHPQMRSYFKEAPEEDKVSSQNSGSNRMMAQNHMFTPSTSATHIETSQQEYLATLPNDGAQRSENHEDHKLAELSTLTSINHRGLQFINDHLTELELRHNLRLQSFHLSLIGASNERIYDDATEAPAARGAGSKIEPADKGARVKLTKLRSLDLFGARQLLELPLDSMIDLEALSEPLRLDLTHSRSLNCSSCRMSWLLDVARYQRLSQASSVPTSRLVNSLWNPVPLFMGPGSVVDSTNSASSLANGPNWVQQNRVILSNNMNQIGCSWPSEMPLNQLLDMEANYGWFSGDQQQQSNNNNNNCHKVSSSVPNETKQQQQQQQQMRTPFSDMRIVANSNSNNQRLGPSTNRANNAIDTPDGASLGSIILASLMLLLLLALTIKLVISLAIRLNRRRHENKMGNFKWLAITTTTPTTTSGNGRKSPSFSIVSSPISFQKTATNSNSSNLNCNQTSALDNSVTSRMVQGGVYGDNNNNLTHCYRQFSHQETTANRLASLSGSGEQPCSCPAFVGPMTKTPANSKAGSVLVSLDFGHSSQNKQNKTKLRGRQLTTTAAVRRTAPTGTGTTTGRWQGNLFLRLAERLSGPRKARRANNTNFEWDCRVQSNHVRTNDHEPFNSVHAIGNQQATTLMNDIIHGLGDKIIIDPGENLYGMPMIANKGDRGALERDSEPFGADSRLRVWPQSGHHQLVGVTTTTTARKIPRDQINIYSNCFEPLMQTSQQLDLQNQQSSYHHNHVGWTTNQLNSGESSLTGIDRLKMSQQTKATSLANSSQVIAAAQAINEGLKLETSRGSSKGSTFVNNPRCSESRHRRGQSPEAERSGCETSKPNIGARRSSPSTSFSSSSPSPSPSLSSLSSGDPTTLDGHIYVTLDGPIKQQSKQQSRIESSKGLSSQCSQNGRRAQSSNKPIEYRNGNGNSNLNNINQYDSIPGLRKIQAEMGQIESLGPESKSKFINLDARGSSGQKQLEQSYDKKRISSEQKLPNSPIEQARQNNKSFELSELLQNTTGTDNSGYMEMFDLSLDADHASKGYSDTQTHSSCKAAVERDSQDFCGRFSGKKQVADDKLSSPIGGDRKRLNWPEVDPPTCSHDNVFKTTVNPSLCERDDSLAGELSSLQSSHVETHVNGQQKARLEVDRVANNRDLAENNNNVSCKLVVKQTVSNGDKPSLEAKFVTRNGCQANNIIKHRRMIMGSSNKLNSGCCRIVEATDSNGAPIGESAACSIEPDNEAKIDKSFETTDSRLRGCDFSVPLASSECGNWNPTKCIDGHKPRQFIGLAASVTEREAATMDKYDDDANHDEAPKAMRTEPVSQRVTGNNHVINGSSFNGKIVGGILDGASGKKHSNENGNGNGNESDSDSESERFPNTTATARAPTLSTKRQNTSGQQNFGQRQQQLPVTDVEYSSGCQFNGNTNTNTTTKAADNCDSYCLSDYRDDIGTDDGRRRQNSNAILDLESWNQNAPITEQLLEASSFEVSRNGNATGSSGSERSGQETMPTRTKTKTKTTNTNNDSGSNFVGFRGSASGAGQQSNEIYCSQYYYCKPK